MIILQLSQWIVKFPVNDSSTHYGIFVIHFHNKSRLILRCEVVCDMEGHSEVPVFSSIS